MNSSEHKNGIYRIEYYGEGLDGYSPYEGRYKVKYVNNQKLFDDFTSAKEFYDLLEQAELIEMKYDSVIEGKRKIIIDQRKNTLSYWPEYHDYILLNEEELNSKLEVISSGVGQVIIYGNVLDHFLGDLIASSFGSTQGQIERNQLFISELSFLQKINIYVKDTMSLIPYNRHKVNLYPVEE